MTGVVEEGDKRGRLIGSPTANLRVAPDKLLPADGVYATRTWIVGDDAAQLYDSVTNLGVRPTVDGLHRRLETHLFDFPSPGGSGNLYHQTLVVEFVQQLRREIRFDGVDALVAQIQIDMIEAREVLRQQSTPVAQPFFLASARPS